MPPTRSIVIALVVCIGLTAYTSFKLHRMNRIVDGDAIAVSKRVVRKTTEETRRSTACYFWVPEKIQADCDYWSGIHVGDRIEVVTVDDESYVKGGDVYTSDGNFVFDKVLLAGEILGVLVCIVMLVINARVASRRA